MQGDNAAYQYPAQNAILATRPGIPIYCAAPLGKLASDAMWSRRFFGGMLVSFAGVALFLAAPGIHGVMAYSVAQRTQEIGVRMALGAAPGAVGWMMLRQGMLLVAIVALVACWLPARRAAQAETTVGLQAG